MDDNVTGYWITLLYRRIKEKSFASISSCDSCLHMKECKSEYQPFQVSRTAFCKRFFFKFSRMHNTVHWFRTKGLRLHDNPSLVESIESADSVRFIFILDPYFAASATKNAINKWRFLLQCLLDLDQSLRKFNSRLFVVRGQPANVLPKLFKEWKTSCFSFEEDPEPFGHARDHNIVILCEQLGIHVITYPTHTLYSPDLIIKQNGGNATLTYRHFLNIIESLPPPQEPCPAPSRLPHTPIKPQFKSKYGVPTLEELGFPATSEADGGDLWKGGETEALQRLTKHLEQKSVQMTRHSNDELRGKLTPEVLLESSSIISPYLRFGCLSTRLLFYELKKVYENIKKMEPPLNFYVQILWKEFFYIAAIGNGNFDKMIGNGICLQVPWDKSPEAILKWTNGQTGFPFIDAIMIQLRQEGWIHHLARHAVASFLTRGHLWISWEEGMKVFDELLLDTDWVTNAGSWLWYSGSSFFQPFFHALCPVRFGRKADPNGDYIRKYVSALRHFPTEFIHEPWSAPEEIQLKANCIIGTDYSIPMLSHVLASKINAERMRQVVSSLSNYKAFH